MSGSRRLGWRARFEAALASALGALLAALVLIALAQIVLRYFFGNSLIWAEEASVVLLLLMTWVGCPCLWLLRGHIAVDILTKGLAPIAQSRLRSGSNAAAIPVGLLIAVLAWQTAAANQGMELAGLNIDSAWKYAPVIVGGILLALAGLTNLLDPPVGKAAEEVL